MVETATGILIAIRVTPRCRLQIPNPKDVTRFLYLDHPTDFGGDQLDLMKIVLPMLTHRQRVKWIADRFD